VIPISVPFIMTFIEPAEEVDSGLWNSNPGPVNWASLQPCSAPWRGSPLDLRGDCPRSRSRQLFSVGDKRLFAQEQMHSGLNLPDRQPDVGAFEVRQTANELSQLDLASLVPAETALVYDYEGPPGRSLFSRKGRTLITLR